MLKLRRVESVLFFLTLLFLPTQLGRHFWPQFSFVYSLPVDYLSPTVYFWDILVICLWVISLLKRGHINRLALSFFYFFILTQSLSLVNANIGVGLIRLQQYTVAGFFGVYIASQNFSDLKKMLFWPLAIGILGESILAIAQFVRGGSLFFWILGERTFSISTPAIAKFDFYGRLLLRPYATFPHPNVLAAFIVVTLPLLLLGRSKISMTAISTILGGIAVFMTVSRTVMVAGFVAGLFLLTKRWKMVLVLVTLILSPFLFTRFSSLLNYDYLSFIRREQLSEIAWGMFLSSPVLGVGLNNFIQVSAADLSAGPSRFLQPVHNIFLLSLAETGILGMLGVLGLIGYPIWRLSKLPPATYHPRTLLLIWGVIIFLGLSDHYFLTLPQGYRLLFLIWGLSLAVSKEKNLVE